jgi:hypothetical protein
MALVWSVYDRVSDVLGSDVMAIALVVAVAVAFYFLMVQPGLDPLNHGADESNGPTGEANSVGYVATREGGK